MSAAIRQAWRTYQREVIPPNAPAVQHEECRRAFYAGAAALFGLVMDASADPLSVEAGADRVAQIADELAAYADDMARNAREGHR